MSAENNSDIIRSYRPAKNDALNRPHLVKPSALAAEDLAKCVVYTDGSAKGSDQSRDQKSFAGWGIYFRNELKNGRVVEGTKYGNLFNSSSREAELRAVLEALKFNRYPCHFEIVTDCADVVEGMTDIKGTIGLLEGDGAGRRVNHGLLKLWRQIDEEIQSNPKIASLSVRWVRSHVLDAAGATLPDPADFDDPVERQIIADCVGNERADKCATLGAIKCIRAALFYYLNVCNDPQAHRRSIETSRKNFFSSQFARDEAIRFLSQQPRDFLPKEVLDGVFDTKTIAKIEQARAQIETGRSADAVFEKMLRSPQVLAFGQSDSTGKFMERCRERQAANVASMSV